MGAVRANGVWFALVAAGLGLGAFVLAAWPEPTLKVVRLPYGEVMPKTPAAEPVPARRQPAARAAETGPMWEPPVVAPEEQARAEEEAGRVLAAVEPAGTGPAPVPSPVELDDRYEQEPPEELGAEPLPGAELTP